MKRALTLLGKLRMFLEKAPRSLESFSWKWRKKINLEVFQSREMWLLFCKLSVLTKGWKHSTTYFISSVQTYLLLFCCISLEQVTKVNKYTYFITSLINCCHFSISFLSVWLWHSQRLHLNEQSWFYSCEFLSDLWRVLIRNVCKRLIEQML